MRTALTALTIVMWWRDVVWMACLAAALATTLIYFGGILTYGAR